MSDVITTGPFRVPDDWPATNAGLAISLKNPTSQARTVRVVVDRCSFTGDPPVCPAFNTATETTICDTSFIVPAGQCLRTQVTNFNAADVLRVTISGAVDDDGGLVEASVVGDRNGTQEPTMFFRHADFVDVDDD